MIYTRWGSKLEILESYGKHSTADFLGQYTLVKTRYLNDPSWQDYYFAEFLRADDGINEILETIDKLPKYKLIGEELLLALREAS